MAVCPSAAARCSSRSICTLTHALAVPGCMHVDCIAFRPSLHTSCPCGFAHGCTQLGRGGRKGVGQHVSASRSQNPSECLTPPHTRLPPHVWGSAQIIVLCAASARQTPSRADAFTCMCRTCDWSRLRSRCPKKRWPDGRIRRTSMDCHCCALAV